MQWRNGRRKYEFLTEREREFIHDPGEFESYYGNDYTRQIRFRIRTKIKEALGVVIDIAWRQQRDQEFARATCLLFQSDYLGGIYRESILPRQMRGYIVDILMGLGYSKIVVDHDYILEPKKLNAMHKSRCG